MPASRRAVVFRAVLGGALFVAASLVAGLPRVARAAPVPAAQPAAIATILSGNAHIVRGAALFAIAEGARLLPGDIVETGSDTTLLRLETPTGGVISLGADTRVLLAPRLAGDRLPPGPPADAYLLAGWLKTDRALLTPDVALRPAGRVVVRQDASGAAVFCELGRATATPRAGGGAAAALDHGEFIAVRPGVARATVEPHPDAAFLSGVPGPFRDTLPARAALFAAGGPAPKPLGVPVYAQLQPWIDAEPALRRGFVDRWGGLARDPAFRRGLMLGLPAHREWSSILFYERTPPRAPHPASAPASGAAHR